MRPDDEGALFEALWSAFASPAAWETLPGAQEALSALRDAGLRCAVVSNFDGRLPALLEGLGLLEFFDGAVFLPGNTGFAKPDPGIFLHAARALGLSPAECVYVGDHPDDDVAAAIAVGMGAIDVGGLATLADLPAQLAASFEARGAPPEPPA
jgi:putative hydrolase of the HAD superfamily